MRRISTFFSGMIVGGALLYTALHYHLVNAADGLHLVPKPETSLSDLYVDIRQFGPQDWVNHPKLAAALMASDQQELMDASLQSSLDNGIDRLLNRPR